MAEIIEQYYAIASVDEVQPHPANPRKGHVGAIVESIEKNDFYGSIVAHVGTGHILAGKHRWEAAKVSGLSIVPVIWVRCSEETARRILAADNRIQDLGGYDEQALSELLDSIRSDGEGFEGTGYDEAAFGRLIAHLGDEALAADIVADSAQESEDGPTGEPAEAPEADNFGEDPPAAIDRAEELRDKWKVEAGQMWLIPSSSVAGKSHRIMCGDSTKPEAVGRLLGDEKPVLMATDPPYGVNLDTAWREKYSSGEYSSGTITNDGQSDWREVWKIWDAPVMYIWHAALNSLVFAESLTSCNYQLRSQIIWNKSVMVFSRGHYHWKHEPCWYAVKKGSTASWVGDRKQNTVWDCGNGSGAGRTGDKSDDFHANHISQKPVELFRKPIRNHTNKGDVVAEPFSGSGSQLIAAEQMGRICLAMEFEPKYVAVALERMAGLGLEPRLAE